MHGILAVPELLIADIRAEGDNRVDGAGLHHEDFTQTWRFVLDAFDLVALRIILRNGKRHLRIVEDVPDLLCGIGLIDRNGNRANGHNGHIKSRPLPAGAGDDGHGVAFCDAPTDQTFGDVNDFLTELAGGEGMPPAFLVLVFHHRALRVALRTAIKQIEQIDVVINRCVQRIGELFDHSGRVRLLICMFSHTPIATSRRIQISWRMPRLLPALGIRHIGRQPSGSAHNHRSRARRRVA